MPVKPSPGVSIGSAGLVQWATLAASRYLGKGLRPFDALAGENGVGLQRDGRFTRARFRNRKVNATVARTPGLSIK